MGDEQPEILLVFHGQLEYLAISRGVLLPGIADQLCARERADDNPPFPPGREWQQTAPNLRLRRGFGTSSSGSCFLLHPTTRSPPTRNGIKKVRGAACGVSSGRPDPRGAASKLLVLEFLPPLGGQIRLIPREIKLDDSLPGLRDQRTAFAGDCSRLSAHSFVSGAEQRLRVGVLL